MLAYTDEETAELKALYQECKDVRAIADYLDRSYRSVISKLVTEGVYQDSAPSESNRATVKQMMRELEEILGIRFLHHSGPALSRLENVKILLDAVRVIARSKETD